MRAATAREMQEIDRTAIKSIGIAGPVLMERAGVAVAREIKGSYRQRRAFIACGTGNNGGDGLVIARELHNAGYLVKVLILGNRNRLSPGCREQYSIARKLKLPVGFGTSITRKDTHGSVLVDALFGTGLNKEISGPAASMIRRINASGCPLVSVDIPSGISADTGQVLGIAVKADLTVTFGLPKIGHFLGPGAEHTGRLQVEDIGFPPFLYEKASCLIPDRAYIASILPQRKEHSHKGHYGHVLLVAGSAGKTGAAFMASRACLRAGAGLVSIAGPASLSSEYQQRATEEMYLPLPDTDGALSEKALEPIMSYIKAQATVLAIGPGLGTAPGTVKLVKRLVRECPVPMVLDADALNALKGASGTIKKAKQPVVLTPHPGEFSRLSGMRIKDVVSDPISAAQLIARKSGAVVLLKGAPTVTATPSAETCINTTGNSGLSKGGSGDVLTGMVAALMAQGASAADAAVSGAFLHGLAADLAVSNGSKRSLLASDVTDTLPEAFSVVEGGPDGQP